MNTAVTAFRFLTELYGEDAPGVLSIFLLPSKRTFWQPTAQIRALLQQTKPYIDTQDVYFGIGLHEKAATEGRGAETDVVGIPGLWCDLDIADPVHRVKNLPPSVDAVETLLLHACPFPPSVLMHTGHGLHAYWLFRELWTLETDSERAAAKLLCHRLQSSVQALAEDQGWHVDSTHDLAHVFRVPRTYNRKSAPVLVTCRTWEPQRRYSPMEFDEFLPVLTPTPDHLQAPTSTTMEIPPLQALQISIRMKFLLRVGEDPLHVGRYPTRSEAAFAVITALVGAGYTDQQIIGIMCDQTYALSERHREKGLPWLGKEITRAREKFLLMPAPVMLQGRPPSPMRFREVMA